MAKGMPWIRAYTSIRTDPRSLILGRLLGDSHAYARILDLRLWLADNAPAGLVAGPHAEVVVEEAVGWRGEPGAFARAAISAGFLRAAPARDTEGSGLVDADWAEEQAAHLAKVERDRKKPDGRKKSRAAPVRDSSGESRELRVESREDPASQAPAVAAPPPLVLAVQETPPPLPEKPKRAPSPTALGEFIDWARAETKARLPADALDPAAGMRQHERVKLGEAVRDHGLETCKAAFRLFSGWQVAQEKGYSVGFFANQWETWLRQVKASGAKPAAASAGKPTVGGYGYDNPYVQALVEAMPAPKKRGA